MEHNSIKPVNITENVLTMLGREISSGRELTIPERLGTGGSAASIAPVARKS